MNDHSHSHTATPADGELPCPLVGLAGLQRALRETAPLIQCITNTVVQAFSANVLLALGAAPAMLDHEADASQFAAMADGLLVNLGTATSHQFLAADAAIATVNRLEKPWVLDPVSIGVADYRSTRIRQAARARPTVIRGNASEIAALAGQGIGPRGVDAQEAVDAVLPAAIELAHETGAVVAVSGANDAIVDVSDTQVRIARIAGGDALMQQVIGTGCALGAAVAAYLATAHRAADAMASSACFEATIAAHAHFKLAGAQAATQAAGPGSFAVAFLDALHALPAQALDRASVHVTAQARGRA